MEIETLEQAWQAGMTVGMRCAWGKRDGMKSIRECAFSAHLDMQTLVCTRGRDFPIDLLADRLRCPECGSRRVRLILTPPSGSNAVRVVVSAR